MASPCRADPGTNLLADPAPAGDTALLVPSADARGNGTLRARLVFDYAVAPLVLIQSDQSTRDVVSAQRAAHLGLSLSAFHRLLAYVNLPLSIAVAGGELENRGVALPPPDDGVGLGDARLGARVHWLGPLEDGFQIANAAELWFPVGSEARYSGDGQLRARLLAVAGLSLRRFAGSFQLGLGFRSAEALPGILPTRVGRTLELGIAARAPLDRGGHVWVGPELAAQLGFGDGAKLLDPRSSAAQALLAVRVHPLLGALELGAAFGPGLGQGAGSPDYRVLAFVGFSPEAPPPPPDADSDGVADSADICLNLPGEPSSDPLMNGCPEAPLDSDGDSIPDGFDACPREPGEPTGVRRTHGCPKPAVPVAPPAPVPEPPAATVSEHEITISEQVQFETGTAVIRPESDAILGAVRHALHEHPEIRLVEIQGHTDDTGTPELNRHLSQERAAAVHAWLVAHGIDAARLRPIGYGQAHPLADNTSEAGRAKNRRVEFRILERRSETRP
jgi:OOP family OmpA-OmpF porin